MGFNLANTSISSTFIDRALSLNLSISAPVNISSLLIPANDATIVVEYGLSPVNIFVFTPYFLNLFIIFLTSFLGESKKATKPINVISFSLFSSKDRTPFSVFLAAKARTCIPEVAISLALLVTMSINSLVKSSSLPFTFTLVHLFNTSSMAPLVIIR